MLCADTINLWAVTKLGIAIIIIAFAIMIAIAILRAAYEIWMGDGGKK